MLSPYYSDLSSGWAQQGTFCPRRRAEPLPGLIGRGTSFLGALSSNRYNIGQAFRASLGMHARTCGWLGVGHMASLSVLEPVYRLRAMRTIMQNRRVLLKGGGRRHSREDPIVDFVAP